MLKDNIALIHKVQYKITEKWFKDDIYSKMSENNKIKQLLALNW